MTLRHGKMRFGLPSVTYTNIGLNSQEMTDYTRLKFRTFLDLMIKNSISGKRVKLVKHVDRYIVSMKEGRLIYKDKELVSVIIFGYDTIEEKEKEK